MWDNFIHWLTKKDPEGKIVNPRDKRVLKEYISNGGNMTKACKKAWVPAWSVHSYKARPAFQSEVAKICDKLDNHIDDAMKALTAAVWTASYWELTGGIERLTKVKRLIQDKSTSINSNSAIKEMSTQELLKELEKKWEMEAELIEESTN